MGEILRCKYLTTTQKKQSKADGLGALTLRKKLEQGSADGERTVGIQEQTNVLYKAKVDYLL